MFNRRLFIIVVSFIVALGTLWWYWHTPQGESLQAGQSVTSSTRFTQNLNGSWDQFSTLRQAWTTESQRAAGKNNQSFLTRGWSLPLPSSEKFTIAAKRLRIPSEWSSRSMLLTFNGVHGHANVYLNGIGNGEKIGEFEGSGGADRIEIPAKAFRYGEDNILLVELTGSLEQRTMFLGSSWPRSGYITGEIRLDAVVETTMDLPKVTVSWNGTTAQVKVEANLLHYGFSSEGPWTVYGVLSDGSAGIAEQTATVQAQEDSNQQPVSLTFSIPDARRWTTQNPFLYQLNLTVTNSRGDLDELAFPLGLRTIALTSGKWVLNDQALTINGEALTPQEEYNLRHAGNLESWLQLQRGKGINLIYFIGQIPDELWLQAADKVGMGLWAELPVELTPSSRLPQPEVFQNVIKEKMLHPSLWAWTVGKGLETDLKAQTYFQQSVKAVQPDLAFALSTLPSVHKGLQPEQLLSIQGNKIQGSWGKVSVETSLSPKVIWLKEPLAAELWSLLIFFLLWMNILSVTWRYKEICIKKPKRQVRRAWFWDGLSVLAREGMLAGLVTSGIFRIPIHFSPWFAHLWPGLELIQAQSPWLIWAMLGMLFVLFRLLQFGVAAPHMPDAPDAVGLVYWYERRYRFAVLIGIGWALLTWGIPFYVPILGYIVLAILFLPIRIRDIRRVGGHYFPFFWVPGIIVSAGLVWAFFRLADWIYLWHMLRP